MVHTHVYSYGQKPCYCLFWKERLLRADLKFCKLTVVLPATLVKYTLISPIVIWSVQLLSYTIKLTKMSKYGRNTRM